MTGGGTDVVVETHTLILVLVSVVVTGGRVTGGRVTGGNVT